MFYFVRPPADGEKNQLNLTTRVRIFVHVCQFNSIVVAIQRYFSAVGVDVGCLTLLWVCAADVVFVVGARCYSGWCSCCVTVFVIVVVWFVFLVYFLLYRY